MTYIFLQHYWWFIVSLLGALLVFLMFVQGANSMVFSLGHSDEERRVVVNSTGRKWEITFTTLVTFGGAFFASFPLFYSTSFGGAYWLWMIILFSFVLQAVSYEFQNKLGNILGTRTFQWMLVANGIIGPLLLGGAVATFFNGSNFVVDKGNLTSFQPVISHWANASYGLDALLDPWNLVFGLAVFFLARILGTLYIINNVDDENIRSRGSVRLVGCTITFLIFFLAFLVRTLLKEGFAVDPSTGLIVMEPMKYLHNLIAIWPLLIVFAVGVLALLLCAGWNNTAFYPSNADLQSSLTIANSCSSEFTLCTMFYVSLLVPFVVAYIAYVWYAMDKKKLTKEEVSDEEAY